MSAALHERPGVATAGIAFLAALLAPFRILFRADIAGPIGGIPPIVPEVLVPLVAPGLAVVVGAHLAREGCRIPTASLAGRAGVGALFGAIVGFPVGAVVDLTVTSMSAGYVSLDTSLLSSITPTTSAIHVLPITLAAAVGVVAGVEWTRRPEMTADALDRGDGVVLVIVGGCGLVVGSSVMLRQVATVGQSLEPGFLFSSRWTVLTVTGHVLLASVLVPLVAVLGGWAGGDHLYRVLARATLATGLVSTALGMGVGYLVATTLSRESVVLFLRRSLPVLVVDGLAAAAVLTLATLVGIAHSTSRRSTPEPTSA